MVKEVSMTVRFPLSIQAYRNPATVMENQIPDDVVKDRFDRLLAEVRGNFERTLCKI